MAKKFDEDSTSSEKLLKLFRKLMVEGKKHYLSELAKSFNCSSQTILRLMAVIEKEVCDNLETGKDGNKRWYRISSINRSRLGLEFEELRYLSICRDLALPYLPEQIRKRVDESLLNFSLLMADTNYATREKLQKEHFAFFNKGYIDYSNHFKIIESLLEAKDNNTICIVQYKALRNKGEIKEHRFAPARFISMNGCLYCLGAGVKENYREMRHPTYFAIHRIIDVIQTNKPILFEIPDVDLGEFGLPWHEPKKFQILFKAGGSAEYVKERIWAKNQNIIEQENGDIILEIVTRSELELTSWVRSFGDNASFI